MDIIFVDLYFPVILSVATIAMIIYRSQRYFDINQKVDRMCAEVDIVGKVHRDLQAKRFADLCNRNGVSLGLNPDALLRHHDDLKKMGFYTGHFIEMLEVFEAQHMVRESNNIMSYEDALFYVKNKDTRPDIRTVEFKPVKPTKKQKIWRTFITITDVIILLLIALPYRNLKQRKTKRYS